MSSAIYSTSAPTYFSDDSDTEEAGLSTLFGEAEEAPERGKKRSSDGINDNPQTDLTADESLQAEAEAAAKAKKKRAKFEVEGSKGLLGPNGLVALHRGIDITTMYKGRGSEKEFARSLTSNLQSWCTTLFGGMHWEDLLMRIESVGGKDEVKAQLNLMREGIRKEGLAKKYGQEGAERILRALGEEAVSSEEARRQLQIDESGENISSARAAQLQSILQGSQPSPLKSPHPDTQTSTITPASTLPGNRMNSRLLEVEDEEVETLIQDTSQVEETEANFDEDDSERDVGTTNTSNLESSTQQSEPQTQVNLETEDTQDTSNNNQENEEGTENTSSQPQTQAINTTEEDEGEME
eukprot:CAMPEP_0118641086 /NCGR_PEP_ID=MMETSP0785-20121206/5093_1 /TAXON_ID=91992 /ORGANISM="Bolidomonas pacifica, Strain CCMP 1866" /LENGTH=352 /DNA_ID=CAMNT_0006532505 /DNA_START=91 /DNA_END=1146 /DNA_ORIENTATION=+